MAGESSACLVTVTNWTSVTRKRGQITVEESENMLKFANCETWKSLFMVIKLNDIMAQTWFPCEECFEGNLCKTLNAESEGKEKEQN